MRKWIEESGVLPKNQRLLRELIQQEKFLNEQSQLQLLSKPMMKKKKIPSPNIADGASFTFDPAMEPPDKPEPQRAMGRSRVWAG